MQRIWISLLAVVAMGAVTILSVTGAPGERGSTEFSVSVDRKNPWTSLDINNRPSDFQFAIVSDRTGGHRVGIFEDAVKRINMLQPEFVLSVGDLIEGYSEDPGRWALEWSEFEATLDRLQMPFFFCPGNHDLANVPMTNEWKRKFGRTYYHFVYKDVLFVVLNSDDPPSEKKVPFQFSPEQQKWFADTLAQNANVRWTFVFLHKPTWDYPNADLVGTGWQAIEDSLGERKYTVFAGHKHNYGKFYRRNREYYMLATTGGATDLRGKEYGEFDHFVWVTMKDDGPVIANLLLDGVVENDVVVLGK